MYYGHSWYAGEMRERWRPVPDWEGLYEVSDLGRVRSVDREVAGKRGVCRFKGRPLKLIISPRGYPRVVLSRPGAKRWHVDVHVLVMLAFVGPAPAGMEVCHAHGSDPGDVRLVNLRYDTRSANIKQMWAEGRGGGCFGRSAS